MRKKREKKLVQTAIKIQCQSGFFKILDYLDFVTERTEAQTASKLSCFKRKRKRA